MKYLHNNECVRVATPFQAKMAVGNVTVKYEEFFHFPAVKPTKSSDCIAKCKLCPSNSQTYKYNITTKGNLLKHLQSSHMQLLKEHKEREKDLMQRHLDTSQTLLSLSSAGTGSSHFTKQDLMLTSIVRNVVGAGGMALQVVEQGWFRQFIHDVKPLFKPVSRVAVKRKLSTLYDEDQQQLQRNMSKVSFNPTVTLDFWTGRGG